MTVTTVLHQPNTQETSSWQKWPGSNDGVGMDKQGKTHGKATFKLILVNQLMTRVFNCAPFSSQVRKFQSNPRVLSFSILLMVRLLFLPAASIFLNRLWLFTHSPRWGTLRGTLQLLWMEWYFTNSSYRWFHLTSRGNFHGKLTWSRTIILSNDSRLLN